ncbi:MAG: glycosyltransferase family 39 protein, partial [Anaerolineae bacterium]
MRLYRLGHQSLWYDELFTVLVAKRPFPEMLNRLITGDVHPPLYYIFEHALMQMGTAEIMARFVPLIFSILSVPLFYRLARLWLGATGALVAVGLLAVSPFHVLFAQEARMYAMLGVWVLGMVYFFQQAWRNGRTRDWSFFALFLTLSLYTHNLAFLYLLAIDLYAILTGIRHRWRPFLAAHTAAFIALSPWVWVWISQVERVQAGFWALPPSPLGLFLAIYLVLFGPSAP